VGDPFGVSIPENFGASSSASEDSDTGSGNPNPIAEGATGNEPDTHKPQVDPVDLDSLERFRFQGKELSKDDLQKLLSGQSGTEATPNAKFDSNFRYDLATVLEDPSKLAQFRRIYPAEYVQIVERALAAQRAGEPVNPNGQPKPGTSNDPRLERLEKIAEQWETAQKEQRVSQITSALDRCFESLAKKYPDADAEVINSRLFALRQMGTQLQDENGKLKENVIEKLFKDDHTVRAKAREDWWKKKVESQKNANSQARDAGQGGAASSPAPKKDRTIKDATKSALAHFEGG
jgi:hypothetical protein